MEQANVAVRGMSCEGCVRSVTKVVSALPGVDTVNVSLAQANALVGFDPAVCSVDTIKAAVRKAGFEAE